MSDINEIVISGRLTRDPETKDAGGNQLTILGLASNRSWPKRDSNNNIIDGEYEERPTFVDVKIWNATLGEKIAYDLSRGDGVLIKGRLDWQDWENDQGEKRNKLEISISGQGHEVMRTERWTSRKDRENGTSGGSNGGGRSTTNALDNGSDGDPDW